MNAASARVRVKRAIDTRLAQFCTDYSMMKVTTRLSVTLPELMGDVGVRRAHDPSPSKMTIQTQAIRPDPEQHGRTNLVTVRGSGLFDREIVISCIHWMGFPDMLLNHGRKISEQEDCA